MIQSTLFPVLSSLWSLITDLFFRSNRFLATKIVCVSGVVADSQQTLMLFRRHLCSFKYFYTLCFVFTLCFYPVIIFFVSLVLVLRWLHFFFLLVFSYCPLMICCFVSPLDLSSVATSLRFSCCPFFSAADDRTPHYSRSLSF